MHAILYNVNNTVDIYNIMATQLVNTPNSYDSGKYGRTGVSNRFLNSRIHPLGFRQMFQIRAAEWSYH